MSIDIHILVYGFGKVYVSSGSGGYLTVTTSDIFTAQYGERVRFYAVPDTGHKFVKFESAGGQTTTQNPFNPIVTQAGTLTVRFEPSTTNGIGDAVRKTLITNLTSNETLISAAVMFETGTGLLTRPRFIRKYQVSEGYAFEYEFPSDTSWTQFIAVGATTTSGGAGLAKFVTQNAGKIALLIASVFSFVIIWKWLDVESQQIEIQAKISDNTKDSITEILTDPTIPAEDKKKLIELILKGASGVTPTDWSSTITTGVIIIAGAYIVSEFIKNKKKEK